MFAILTLRDPLPVLVHPSTTSSLPMTLTSNGLTIALVFMSITHSCVYYRNYHIYRPDSPLCPVRLKVFEIVFPSLITLRIPEYLCVLPIVTPFRDSEAVEGGTETGTAMILPKRESSGFRITSVTFHPAERAISDTSRRVLSLLLKVTCICSYFNVTAERGRWVTRRHVKPKCVRICLPEVRQESTRGWCHCCNSANVSGVVLTCEGEDIVHNHEFCL